MKKFITSIVAVIMATAMAFGMTACGSTPEEKLKSYIESDTFQSQLDTYKTSFGSTIDIDVEAEDNKLIYEFTYTTQIEDDVLDSVKDQLETSFESMSSTFEDIANELKTEVKIDDPVVVIKLLNADGTTITELSYEATE